jgi:hypothetical protein
MKNKVFWIAICIFLLGLYSCMQGEKTHEPGWKGTVAHKEGITEVINPETPAYGNLEFDFEEALVIGNEEDENTSFYNVYDIEVDDQGNIYILDAGNHRIQKYAQDGQYLQTIGKEGQGPGEFDRVYSFLLDEENNIYVAGNRKIHMFNSDGEFIKNINLSLSITNFCILPDKTIMGVATVSTEEGRTRRIFRLDSEGKEIENIAEFMDVKTVQRKGKEGRVTTFAVSHSYNPQLILSPAPNHKFLYAFSAEYILYRINSEGKINLIANKLEKSHPITQKEKDKIVQDIREHISGRGQTWPKGVIEEACQFPTHRPYFYSFITDDEGRIYVRRLKSTLDESETLEYDIFDSEGHYLYKAVLSFSPDLIKGGYVYDISTDEDTGEVKIRRYEIMNWDEIKTAI